MTTKIYEYNYTLPRKDGSLGHYVRRFKREVIAERTVLTDDEIEIIHKKLLDGVTKKRICTDHKITFLRLQKIINENLFI